MSFIGLVTRKEKDTGVNLIAKVVTESKKKFTKKVFRVKVKANALDDFSCCVIDHGTVVNKINSSQEMNQLIDDVNFSYNGVNGTVISYKIIDVAEPLLSDYLAGDGKIKNRPKYGEGNATGYIEITVTKNDAIVQSRILASVKSISAEEVLNDSSFTQAALWASIRGGNDSYQQGSEWSGHNNIMTTLNFIRSKTISSMSVDPVGIAWTVTDETLPYASMSGVYSDIRINAETGEVVRSDYKDACKLVDAITGVDIKAIGSPTNALQKRVRIGGITLTADLTLGNASKKVTFACSTISKYLTNQEVMEVVLNSIHLFREDYSEINYKEKSDSSFELITAPASGGIYTLRAYGNRGSEEFSSSELKLNVGEIIGVTLQNEVRDFNGSAVYPDTGLYVSAFGSGFQADGGEVRMKLTIDFDAIKNATETNKQFSCSVGISVGGYSANGLTPGGAPLNNSRYQQFKIDTSAITS